MRIDNSFTVPLPVDDAWKTLLDVGQIAECMPGAVLDSIDGDVFTGRVKVKVGPVSLTYKGQAEITGKDAASHVAVLVARGRDARGNGTAGANVTMQLAGDGDRTRVQLLTELDVTGRPAQMGRGVMTEVSNRLIGQFAEALAAKLAAERVAPGPGPATPSPAPATAPSAPSAPGTPSTSARTATGQSSGRAPADGLNGARHAAPRSQGRPAQEINILSLAGRSALSRLWQALVRLCVRLVGRR
jgi:carbon monoxide dehydrogenase subunit G